MYEMFGGAEKLMMKVRALKWQAATLQTVPRDPAARAETDAILVALQTVEASMRATMTEDALAEAARLVGILADRLGGVSPHTDNDGSWS